MVPTQVSGNAKAARKEKQDRKKDTWREEGSEGGSPPEEGTEEEEPPKPKRGHFGRRPSFDRQVGKQKGSKEPHGSSGAERGAERRPATEEGEEGEDGEGEGEGGTPRHKRRGLFSRPRGSSSGAVERPESSARDDRESNQGRDGAAKKLAGVETSGAPTSQGRGLFRRPSFDKIRPTKSGAAEKEKDKRPVRGWFGSKTAPMSDAEMGCADRAPKLWLASPGFSDSQPPT